MSHRIGRIRGYDGLNLIYKCIVPLRFYSEKQMQSLLRTLTAKAGLTNDEIVGAYARRGSQPHNSHLIVNRGGPHSKFSCGSNPFFTAAPVSGGRPQIATESPED